DDVDHRTATGERARDLRIQRAVDAVRPVEVPQQILGEPFSASDELPFARVSDRDGGLTECRRGLRVRKRTTGKEEPREKSQGRAHRSSIRARGRPDPKQKPG